MARAPRRRSRLQGLLMGLTVAALVLWLAEVGLRILEVRPAYDSGTIAGWRTAGALGTHPMKGPHDQHSFLVSTNADGLRTGLARQRSARKRVAILGDSTVFGWGVDDGGTVADGLEAALGARGREVEVLNGGQPGYSTVQAAWLFQEVVAEYAPDLVILFLPLHDHNLVLVSDAEVLRGARGPVATLRVALARHSALYAWLRGQLFREASQPFILPDRRDGEPRVPRVSEAERAEALSAVRARQAAAGHRLALGLLPFLGDLTGAMGERVGVAEARAWTTAEGVPLLDARRCCGTEAGALVLPDDPGHLTAAGNFAAAEGIAAEVAGLLGE